MYKLLAVSPFVCFCQAQLILGISVVCVVKLFNLPCVRAERAGEGGGRSISVVFETFLHIPRLITGKKKNVSVGQNYRDLINDLIHDLINTRRQILQWMYLFFCKLCNMAIHFKEFQGQRRKSETTDVNRNVTHHNCIVTQNLV